MNVGKSFFIFAFVFAFGATSAQKKFSDYVSLGGYVKYMHTFTGNPNTNQLINSGLVHNRINADVYFNDHLELDVGWRNRLFFGSAIQLNMFIIDQLDFDGGVMDLNFAGGDVNRVVYASAFDRLHFKYYYKDWETHIGRQRINWGINTYWNANDVFNAYNFIDFDYEERPGVDAVRLVRNMKNMKRIELAYSAAKDFDLDASTFGLLYGFNKWEYDFQLIAAKSMKDYVIGGGWAGGFGDIGFKGELSYFYPDSLSNSTGDIAISLGLDYIINDKSFLGIGLLHNSTGLSSIADLGSSLALSNSAKALSPFKYSVISTYSYAITERMSGVLSAFYSPTQNSLLLIPSLSQSLGSNFELAFFMQNFFMENNGEYSVLAASAYFRLKYSF